jgi:hypothetical protein
MNMGRQLKTGARRRIDGAALAQCFALAAMTVTVAACSAEGGSGAEGSLPAHDYASLRDGTIVQDVGAGRILYCKQRVHEEGEARYVDVEHYLLDRMDAELAASNELRAHSGLTRVTSCAEARTVRQADRQLDGVETAASFGAEGAEAETPQRPLPAPDDPNEALIEKISNPWLIGRRGSIGFYVWDGEFYQFRCSGSILTYQQILTAAHCFAGNTDVHAVAVMYQAPEGDRLTFAYVVPQIHPDYSGTEDWKDDIALMTNISGSWTVPETGEHRLALHRQTPKVGKPFYVHGYGAKLLAAPPDGNVGAGLAATIGHAWTLPLDWVHSSNKYFGSTVPNDWAASSTCKGDSGGPAIRAYKSSSSVITGITVANDWSSWGALSLCVIPGDRQLFTSVSPKADWLAGLIGGCRALSDAGITYYACF